MEKDLVCNLVGDDGESEVVSAFDLKNRLNLGREPLTKASFGRCIIAIFGKKGYEIEFYKR
jgi:hypothetical protein